MPYSLISSTTVILWTPVIVDALSCETTEAHAPWVYKPQQSTSTDPLVSEMFNSTETLDTRARLIQENTDDANPYGI